ncbi:methyltransferase domain-containing protein [Amycolatopsis nigrescens]|uniref:methyltransferase domain-containing protein n=1 Tax=Amycolatopsis nigrescens TaxID=381445 RepID=UPI00038087AB|nr:class I SAM-dependent methyltransferase [Amycolatopsis nigrescens]
MRVSIVRNYLRSLERSNEALTRADRPATFTMQERVWDLLPEVFAPVFSPTTGFSLQLLGLTGPGTAPRTGSLLEIGCGTGIIAVSGALAGCDRVVATDISPAAVRNAAMNAARHGVDDRVRAVRSDLFDALDEGERFDTIYWHSNYVLAPADYQYRTMHERGYVDAGYATHRRFLAEAPRWLNPGGSVLLHFSTRGDLVELLRIAGECGRALRGLRSIPSQEGDDLVDHLLIEVTAVAPERAVPAWDLADANCGSR